MNFSSQGSVLGCSFEAESLPDFDEFDSYSVVDGYQHETSRRPSEYKMAPTTTIETITITRPLKLDRRYRPAGPGPTVAYGPRHLHHQIHHQIHQVAVEEMARNQIAQVIAFVCGLIVIALMVMALASTDWLMAAGWRQGLFVHCIALNAPTPLPFNTPDPPGDCYQARPVAYIRVAAALCILTLITDLIATLLTGLGLRSNDHRTKYKYYRIAVYIMILALVSILAALVVYPVCFAAELNQGNRTVWEFGWAYGVGWGAAIFLFGGVVLLLCDKESEEIFYKERKIVHRDVEGPGGRA